MFAGENQPFNDQDTLARYVEMGKKGNRKHSHPESRFSSRGRGQTSGK
jgi:hypothetical protein